MLYWDKKKSLLIAPILGTLILGFSAFAGPQKGGKAAPQSKVAERSPEQAKKVAALKAMTKEERMKLAAKNRGNTKASLAAAHKKATANLSPEAKKARAALKAMSKEDRQALATKNRKDLDKKLKANRAEQLKRLSPEEKAERAAVKADLMKKLKK